MIDLKSIKRCSKCLISENFPGIKFDDNSVCNYCLKYEKKGNDNKVIQTNAEKISNIIEKHKGKNLYDVIVAYSGGKDSTYTLHILKKEFNLNVLALLIDNDFVSETAIKNARNVTSNLGIDLIIFKPDATFMHKMYKTSIEGNIYNKSQLTRANAACLSCINLINNVVLNEAIIRKIPIIAGGYIGGQIPVESGLIYTSNNFLNEYKDKNKEFLVKTIDKKFNLYLNISELQENQTAPVIINPLLGLKYNEEDIITLISQYGWNKPTDTGMSSSNCLLNDYAISMHFEKHKYHSYEAEICLQVRRGELSKEVALQKLTDIKPPESFTKIKNKLK